MKHIQNYQKSIGKSNQPMDFKNLLKKKSKNQKSFRLLPNVCDFQNEWISILCNFRLRRGWTWTVQKHGCQQQHEQGKEYGRQQHKDQQQKI